MFAKIYCVNNINEDKHDYSLQSIDLSASILQPHKYIYCIYLNI